MRRLVAVVKDPNCREKFGIQIGLRPVIFLSQPR